MKSRMYDTDLDANPLASIIRITRLTLSTIRTPFPGSGCSFRNTALFIPAPDAARCHEATLSLENDQLRTCFRLRA